MISIPAVVQFVRPKLPTLRLVVGSIGSLVIGVFAQALAFVLLARFLGTTEFGHLTTITAVTALANTLCGFGPGEVLRRIVSRDPARYPEALGHTTLMIVLTGVGLSVLLIVGLMPFVPVGADHLERLMILGLLVPTNVIMPSYLNLVENVFLARHDFKRANLINSGAGVVRAIVAAIACLGFGVGSLATWTIWWAACHVALVVAGFLAIRHFGKPRWRVLQQEIWLGWHLAWSSFLIMLRHNIDVLVLSAVTSAEFVAVYGAGRRLIGAALVVPGAFDRVIYGKLAVAGHAGAAASLKLARKYLVYSIAISTLTSIGLFVVAPLAPLAFGAAYQEATRVVQVLAWTVVPTAIQFLAFDALNAADRHKVSAAVSGVANVIGAAMVVVLGSAFGPVGIYVALYSSDIARGTGLWLALQRLARVEASQKVR
jgi:O-antigen/teichoic acid export membrane protein